MGCHALLQGILPTQGLNPGLLHWEGGSLPSEVPEKPKNTGVDSLSLLQGNFPTQELNWCLLHCRQILYQLSYLGSLWNGIFPAIMVKKDVTAIRDSSLPKLNFWAQEEQYCLSSSRQSLPGQRWVLRSWVGWRGDCEIAQETATPQLPTANMGLRMWVIKEQDLASDSRDVYERNGFSEPRCLHLSKHRRVLNSWAWDICFSLINTNLWRSENLPALLQSPI